MLVTDPLLVAAGVTVPEVVAVEDVVSETERVLVIDVLGAGVPVVVTVPVDDWVCPETLRLRLPDG